MKALSLRQPWVAAVLRLGKTIENRRWYTTYRGRFLIHAAKYMTALEHHDTLEFCENVLGIARCFEIEQALDKATLQFGGFVGVATLVDVVPPRPEFCLLGVDTHYPARLAGTDAWRWHIREQYGFVLEDVKPFKTFIPWPGLPGFFDVPASIAAAAEAM
jgi:hypothetical protein